MITDAKALFDSFHREGLSGNLVDKRAGLEILVPRPINLEHFLTKMLLVLRGTQLFLQKVLPLA